MSSAKSIRVTLISCLLVFSMPALLYAQSEENNSVQTAYPAMNATDVEQEGDASLYNTNTTDETPPNTPHQNMFSGFKKLWAAQPVVSGASPRSAGVSNTHAFWSKRHPSQYKVNPTYERGFKERYQQMMENPTGPLPDGEGEGEAVNSEPEE